MLGISNLHKKSSTARVSEACRTERRPPNAGNLRAKGGAMRTADEANWRLEQADSAQRSALVIIWTVQIRTHHIFREFCHLGLCQHTMRSNAWTSLEEYEFLTEYIPRFLKQQGIRVIFPLLAEVADAFLLKFPSRSEKFNRDSLIPVRCTLSCSLPLLIFSENPLLVWKSHSRRGQGWRCQTHSRPLREG